jgi:hypothetical protein
MFLILQSVIDYKSRDDGYHQEYIRCNVKSFDEDLDDCALMLASTGKSSSILTEVPLTSLEGISKCDEFMNKRKQRYRIVRNRKNSWIFQK